MIVFLFKVEKVLVGLSGSGRVRFSTNLLRKHVTQIHPSFITRGSSSSKSRDAAVADHHGGIRRPAPRHRAPRGDRQEERQEIGARAEPRRQDGQAAAKRGCTHIASCIPQAYTREHGGFIAGTSAVRGSSGGSGWRSCAYRALTPPSAATPFL